MSKLWGVRYDDREFEVGEEIPNSHRWELGVHTDEELDGVCAISVSNETDFLEYLDGEKEADGGELDRYNKAIANDEYYCEHTYLVMIESNWGWEWGEDEDEIILSGAEVVRKIK